MTRGIHEGDRKQPIVLAAHSLGCLAVAWWAELSGQPWGWPVAGALLVAPADVSARPLAAELADFAPAPSRAPALSLDRSGERRRSLDSPGTRGEPGCGVGQPLRQCRPGRPHQRGQRPRLVGGRTGIARPGDTSGGWRGLDQRGAHDPRRQRHGAGVRELFGRLGQWCDQSRPSRAKSRDAPTSCLALKKRVRASTSLGMDGLGVARA